MASWQTVDHIISRSIFPLLICHSVMHIKICTLLCHFNWLKSSNRQQNAPPPTSQSWPRLKALAIFCHAKHLSAC